MGLNVILLVRKVDSNRRTKVLILEKGIQLEKNVNCTILFPWIAQERQVIVRGKASKISEQESSEYFDSRPKGSQIGAWVSEQSSEIASREDLDAKLDFYLQKFKN